MVGIGAVWRATAGSLGCVLGGWLAVDMVCHGQPVHGRRMACTPYWGNAGLLKQPTLKRVQSKLRVIAKKLVVWLLAFTSGLSAMLASNHFLRT